VRWEGERKREREEAYIYIEREVFLCVCA